VLKSIDILIGLAVVMLAASMAVTVMTGFINHIFNTRGRNLQTGIADLLHLINPDFTRAVVEKIANAVLTHPLIRDAEGRLGTVVHREELTKLLMELAAGNGPQKLETTVQDQLKKALQDQGIADPAKTIESVRSLVLKLEKSNPELSNMARANLAILHAAESDFVAKINSWFDQTMDRVSHRFTSSTRGLTFACSLLLAVVVQLDTIALVNRISVDDAVRASLIAQAQKITDSNAAPTDTELPKNMVESGVMSLPDYGKDGLKGFLDLRHDLGIVITTLLLSLGAPFWYNALKQLLQLRSKLADKDDDQRKERQSTQAVVITPAGPAPVTPGVLQGGRTDATPAG
jgi:hypothetical protein